MKFLYFLRWCFDLSRWRPYQKRFAIYMITMIAGTFLIDPKFIWAGVILVWLDLIVMMIQDSWNSFCTEQKNIVNKLKGKE
jgi:hypothetical protein